MESSSPIIRKDTQPHTRRKKEVKKEGVKKELVAKNQARTALDRGAGRGLFNAPNNVGGRQTKKRAKKETHRGEGGRSNL